MTNEQLTQISIEQAERISHIEADVKTLFTELKAYHEIVEGIHELALSVQKLSDRIENMDVRLGAIENDKRTKAHAIWQIVVSAVLGGGLTLLVTTLLGG